MQETADANEENDRAVRSTAGRTLYLIPDNAHRPLSLASAVFKGGTDVVSTEWGTSPLMRRLFADRWYVYGKGTVPVGVRSEGRPFDKVVVSYFPDHREEFFKTIRDRFAIDLTTLDCSLSRRTGNHALLTLCVGVVRFTD